MSTDFTSTRNRFHFPNSFVNPIITLPRVGTINTSGLCGGMSFASLDYYHAGLPIPTHIAADFPGGASVPPVGSRLRQYIFDRQLNSFDPTVNPSVHKFITQALPIGRTCYEVTVEDEWPLITAAVDGGQPVPLGLIAESVNPTNSHQVVASGYDPSPKRIQIYDCNHPDTFITLLLDDASQVVKESAGERWMGLFLEQYVPKDPTDLDLRLSLGINTNPGATATPQRSGRGRLTVRNDGDYAAHLQALDVSVIGPLGEDLDGLFTSHGTPATLGRGAVQSYLAGNDAFGTEAGTYELVGWYQSRQGEMVPGPTGSRRNPDLDNPRRELTTRAPAGCTRRSS
jgi:hypothetical protein